MIFPPPEKAQPEHGMPGLAVRYRPGEALRWLDGVADDAVDRARENASVFTNGAPFSKKIREAAGVLIDLSKSAYAELTKRRAAASEFTFHDNEFTIARPTGKQTLPYSCVKKFTKDRDKVVISLDRSSLTIRPYAYIVAGKVRVPIGWDRNGSEVPYEVLFEEWAARCRLRIESA